MLRKAEWVESGGRYTRYVETVRCDVLVENQHYVVKLDGSKVDVDPVTLCAAKQCAVRYAHAKLGHAPPPRYKSE